LSLLSEWRKEDIQHGRLEATSPHISADLHFNPRYKPGDQRFCVCPDGDFFAALRSGKADVVTNTIKMATEKEILYS
jgi:cation diffusion facilitator CzcD-associated flavoprotein CzcO